MSLALRTADAEGIEEEWEQRESQLPPMDECEWTAFDGKEVETVAEAAERADATHQKAHTAAGGDSFGQAARRLVAIEDALKKLVTDIQEIGDRVGPSTSSKIVRLHEKMLRWRRWLRICDGKRQYPDTHRMFHDDDCAQVLGDAPTRDDLVRAAVRNNAPGGPRRIALREICRMRLLHAREKYEGAVTEGAVDTDRIRTRLLADINKAVEEGRDPRWECFRAVGRAKAALAGKRTAPRLDQPGMRAIKRTGATRMRAPRSRPT
jgi:hypothetical protein